MTPSAVKQPAPQQAPRQSPQQRVHRRFAPLVAVFAVIVCVISGLIFYTAFGQTTVLVKTLPQRVDADFTIQPEDVDAPVVSMDVDATYTYTDFTGVEATPAQATGTVTIVNKYSSDQPLVETTRLLSDNGSDSGVLFRTAETVTVPSGGEVEVAVYADEPGKAGNIAPSKFEIVALWDGLKDNIYAESSENMTGGLVYNASVTEENLASAIEEANTDMRQSLISDLEQKANATPGTINADSLFLNVIEQTALPEIGTQTDEIIVHTSGTVSAVAVDKDKLTELLQTQSGSENFGPAEVSYVVEQDESSTDGAGQLVIQATVPVEEVTTDASFINVEQLTNRTPEEIQSIVSNYDQVQSVEVKFRPFWLSRSPVGADDIQVKVGVN